MWTGFCYLIQQPQIEQQKQGGEDIPTWLELNTQPLFASSANDPVTSSILARTGTETPFVTLYRDSAEWCFYCQKLWIELLYA
jgi:hypothetical protein